MYGISIPSVVYANSLFETPFPTTILCTSWDSVNDKICTALAKHPHVISNDYRETSNTPIKIAIHHMPTGIDPPRSVRMDMSTSNMVSLAQEHLSHQHQPASDNLQQDGLPEDHSDPATDRSFLGTCRQVPCSRPRRYLYASTPESRSL